MFNAGERAPCEHGQLVCAECNPYDALRADGEAAGTLLTYEQWQAIGAWRAKSSPVVLAWVERVARQARKANDPDADGFDALRELARVVAESGR